MTRRSSRLRSIGHGSCCSVSQAEEGGVRLTLPTSHGKWLLLSGTKYQKAHDHNAKLCDYILFLEEINGVAIAPVELKGGGFSARHVAEQIQQGANLAASLVDNFPARFAPVLVHKGGKTIEFRQLKKLRIKFRGLNVLIQPAKSPFSVADVDWPSTVTKR